MTERQKPWYKQWWGIIIAICIWPFFLLWFVWIKSKQGLPAKIAWTVIPFVLIIFGMAQLGSSSPQNNQTTNTAATTQTQPASTPKPTPTKTATQTTTQPTTTTKPAPTPTQTPQSTPQHTIVYQFSLMSGSMNATDQQNVGISWKDPTTGKNQIPTDIAGAIQQINAGNYTVTYHVSSVNKDNLNDGVNNYSDPDATIACTILVDGSPVSNETAPESGYADCSGNGLDSQSGT